MTTSCTRCESTGFLNLAQVDDTTRQQFDETGDHQVILKWIATNSPHDVSVLGSITGRMIRRGRAGRISTTVGFVGAINIATALNSALRR